MKVTELDPMDTTTRVRWSGENPSPCTSNCPRYKGLKLPGDGSPSLITPNSVLSAASVTETVLENCSAAYTRSRWVIGISGADTGPGTCPANAVPTTHASAPGASFICGAL